ncbi:MAG: TIM barrel protein [Sedimentisphaerales bacterium]|nr:TIM barrel protein [Sedimentisphaerales bacterium]
MLDKQMGRRSFLKYSAAAAMGVTLAGTSGAATTAEKNKKWYKALKIGMLPKELPDAEKFKLAKRCGFEGIDGIPVSDRSRAEKQAELARNIGVPIHGLVYGWWPPFDAKAEVIKKSLEEMEKALRCANVMGATTVLLVPTKVTETFRYADAYEQSQKHIRRLLPLAKEMGVIIAVENVWNKFLLSPLEFARYIDELESPYARAYFDTGNVIIDGYAQDWIRTLGKRIVKLDLKDFRRKDYKWTNLGDGDVNWPEVCQSLNEVGFEGYMTAELASGDEAYLSDLAKRIDRLMNLN